MEDQGEKLGEGENETNGEKEGEGENCVSSINIIIGDKGRIVASGIVFDDKLWMVAGTSGNNTFYDDVLSSSDGISWNTSTVNAEFGKRCRNTLLSFGEKMWLIGGEALTGLKNDVWAT